LAYFFNEAKDDYRVVASAEKEVEKEVQKEVQKEVHKEVGKKVERLRRLEKADRRSARGCPASPENHSHQLVNARLKEGPRSSSMTSISDVYYYRELVNKETAN
jgi:hypothetical protein